MRLSLERTVPEQIKQHATDFIFDLRGEAAGDKAASTAVIKWLIDRFDIDLTVVESESGRTPFMLSACFEHPRVTFTEASRHAPVEGLDLHTAMLPTACLWELNAYMASLGYRPGPFTLTETEGDVVLAVRTHARYDERKDMAIESCREAIDLLEREGYRVTVLYDRKDERLPEAQVLSFDEALSRITGAQIFIGGDTGFSHIRAGTGKPQIALYPDYFRFSKASLTKSTRIAYWWGLPELVWTPFNSLPNAKCMRVVELGTDHRFAPEHIRHAMRELLPDHVQP